MSIAAPSPIPLAYVLQEQVGAYARSVDRLAQGGTTKARLAVDLIDVGLRLYESAQEFVRRWHADVEGGLAALDPAQAEEFTEVYRALDHAFDRIARAVDVANADARVERFSRERAYLKAMLTMTPDKVARMEQQATDGKARTTAEVRDELRRRMEG